MPFPLRRLIVPQTERDTVPAQTGILEEARMSAWGQKPTCAPQKVMSALPSKADTCVALAYVCFGPIADIAPVS
jgi:hypothetical protein